MTYRKQLLITTTALALAPFAAQAANTSWTGNTDNSWENAGNWSNGVPTGNGFAITITNGTNSPIQVKANETYNTLTTGTTTIGSADTVNINSGETLATRNITLQGGTLTGAGSFKFSGSGTGAGISGFGTISVPFANTVNLTANGTAGSPLVLSGGNTISGGTITVSGAGGLNVNSDTLSSLTITDTTGPVNLNGATLSGVTLGGVNGQFNLTGNSTLTGSIARNNTDTFNTNANTLSLKSATISGVSGGNVFNIGTGGILDNALGNSSVGNDGNTNLAGGKITNSGGGTFTFSDQITGFGTVQGPVTIAGSAKAIGGTLTLDGTTGAIGATGITLFTDGVAGSVLDLKGSINFGGGGFLYPNPSAGTGSGVVQLDGATLNGTISAGKGTVNVVNSNTTLNGTFNANGVNGVSSDVTIKNGAGLTLANTVGTTAMFANNFTMEKNSTLTVGSTHNALSVSGNFSYQQTDTINGWTNGGTAGLGPNLIMTGGTALNPTTLEVGSVNKGGYNPTAWVQNFALSSLTLGSGAYDKLVDTFQNATPSGWTSGSEVLYLDGLFGVTPGGGHVIPTLNLMGIEAFLLTQSGKGGFLYNGLYTDPNGGEVNIIGASPAPEPAALLLFGSGLAGLALVRRRRRN